MSGQGRKVHRDGGHDDDGAAGDRSCGRPQTSP
jgi:hypothetical protein